MYMCDSKFQFKIFSFCKRYILDMLSGSVVVDSIRNFTLPTPTSIDRNTIQGAYDDVRSDTTETMWAVFKYDNNCISFSSKGSDFQEFKKQFADTERCYGYLRLKTGDEMSRRTKFIMITWVGREVGVMQRARITNDKALVKEIIKNYALEFQLETLSEIDSEYFLEELEKVAGTHYGTGI